MVERSFDRLPPMKNPLHYIEQYPERTKGLLGISYDQFLRLTAQAQMIEEQRQAEIERTKVRLNAKGGGCKPKLSPKEEVCLCLFYLRQLPTFEVLGLHFGLSKTQANDTFHDWLGILRELLPASLLEQVETRSSDYELVRELLVQFQLLVDSTEQARERPEDLIARERFRLHPETYEQVILAVCGLVRLRIGTVVLPVPEQSSTRGVT